MIVITGWNSQIAAEFRDSIPAWDEAYRGAPREAYFPLDADRYFFCQGLLRPKQAGDQTDAEITEGLAVNYSSIVRRCRQIIAVNDAARICIMGSESGYRGSFDGVYAAAKMALHHFIVSTILRTPLQQLVGISPGIVENAGMTTRRLDIDNLERRRTEHPKRRFLTSLEVAEMARFLLYGSDYVTGTVIRMHGGLQ